MIEFSNGVLIGNSFPLSLIRRKVFITPEKKEILQRVLQDKEVFSFWGHSNSIKAASDFLACDLSPDCERPAISIDKDGYPNFNGQRFQECWVVSANYIENFRPAIGEEIAPEKIASWQVLFMKWE